MQDKIWNTINSSEPKLYRTIVMNASFFGTGFIFHMLIILRFSNMTMIPLAIIKWRKAVFPKAII